MACKLRYYIDFIAVQITQPISLAISHPLSQGVAGAEPGESGRSGAEGALEAASVHQRAAAPVPHHLQNI